MAREQSPSDSAPPELAGPALRILERTASRLASLHGELENLRRLHSDCENLPGARMLVDALLLVVAEVERAIHRQARRLHEQPGPRGEASFRGRVGGQLAALETLLPGPIDLVRKTPGRDIEPLLVIFREMANSLSHGRELIFDPADEYEFQGTLRDDLAGYAGQISRRLEDAIRALPQLTVISYPAQLHDSTLLHAVLAHEVTHLAIDRVAEGESVPVWQNLINARIDQHYDDLVGEIKNRVGAQADDADTQRRVSEENFKMRRRLKKWFEELACDALALQSIGPAYLFALVELEMATDRWVQKRGMPGFETHPGLGWRASRLLPIARAYFDADTEPAVAARVALDEIELLLPTEQDEASPVERRIINEALEDLEAPEQLETILGLSSRFSPASLERLLGVVWEKLNHGIPPAEYVFPRDQPSVTGQPPFADHESVSEPGQRVSAEAHHSVGHSSELSSASIDELLREWSQPIDWRTILNGGWIFWLSGRARTPTREGEHRHLPMSPHALNDWRDLNELIRGTLELRNIHHQLHELSNQLDVLNAPQPA